MYSSMVGKSLGKYDFCSNDKQWCVSVKAPDGKWISETWDEDNEPDIEGLAPSEVIDLIEERLKSYWICTSREEKLARIAGFREVAEQQDHNWAQEQISFHQREIDNLSRYLAKEDSAS